MADQKVSQLPLATAPQKADELYLVQSGASKKTPLSAVFEEFGNLIPSWNVDAAYTPVTFTSTDFADATVAAISGGIQVTSTVSSVAGIAVFDEQLPFNGTRSFSVEANQNVGATNYTIIGIADSGKTAAEIQAEIGPDTSDFFYAGLMTNGAGGPGTVFYGYRFGNNASVGPIQLAAPGAYDPAASRLDVVYQYSGISKITVSLYVNSSLAATISNIDVGGLRPLRGFGGSLRLGGVGPVTNLKYNPSPVIGGTSVIGDGDVVAPATPANKLFRVQSAGAKIFGSKYVVGDNIVLFDNTGTTVRVLDSVSAQIQNDSEVPGATVAAALNSLLEMVRDAATQEYIVSTTITPDGIRYFGTFDTAYTKAVSAGVPCKIVLDAQTSVYQASLQDPYDLSKIQIVGRAISNTGSWGAGAEPDAYLEFTNGAKWSNVPAFCENVEILCSPTAPNKMFTGAGPVKQVYGNRVTLRLLGTDGGQSMFYANNVTLVVAGDNFRVFGVGPTSSVFNEGSSANAMLFVVGDGAIFNRYAIYGTGSPGTIQIIHGDGQRISTQDSAPLPIVAASNSAPKSLVTAVTNANFSLSVDYLAASTAVDKINNLILTEGPGAAAVMDISFDWPGQILDIGETFTITLREAMTGGDTVTVTANIGVTTFIGDTPVAMSAAGDRVVATYLGLDTGVGKHIWKIKQD